MMAIRNKNDLLEPFPSSRSSSGINITRRSLDGLGSGNPRRILGLGGSFGGSSHRKSLSALELKKESKFSIRGRALSREMDDDSSHRSIEKEGPRILSSSISDSRYDQSKSTAATRSNRSSVGNNSKNSKETNQPTTIFDQAYVSALINDRDEFRVFQKELRDSRMLTSVGVQQVMLTSLQTRGRAILLRQKGEQQEEAPLQMGKSRAKALASQLSEGWGQVGINLRRRRHEKESASAA